ncbi:MAG: alcohol dehydrogenase catalytic domain-containing protein [Vicinamibacteria bacterium]|nr:alcohol dehydrogenase catalytic domain-containing protein [Vicinamibacteria bacterium]
MKAGILYGARDIRVGHVPDPELGPGQVLIKSAYAGLCGTDLHIYRGEFSARVGYPAVPGHEFGGTVEECGRDVRGLERGDAVAIDPIVSCHACTPCLTGRINACRALRLLGIDLPGGSAQYVVAPASHAFKLPERVPLAHAPLVEVYGLGHHVLARGRVEAGETVVILGAGKLGLAVLDVLCHGASPGCAIAVDVDPARLAIAARLGAEATIDARHVDPVEQVLELTDGIGADCVIECIGHWHDVPGRAEPLEQAVRMLRSAGRIVTAGLGDQPTSVHFRSLVIKEAQIIASRVSLGEFPRALRMLDKGLLHPALMITDRLPMREVGRAFERLDAEDPRMIKMVLDVQDV